MPSLSVAEPRKVTGATQDPINRGPYQSAYHHGGPALQPGQVATNNKIDECQYQQLNAE